MIVLCIFFSSTIICSMSCMQHVTTMHFSMTCKPSDTFIRDPVDCNSYYQCMFGLPIKMKCAKGLCFNSMTDMCDWCDLVPECTKIITTEKPVQTTVKPSDPQMACPVMNMSIFLGHPNDCTKFYYCRRNQIIGKIGFCAEGLWFDFWKQRCEIPWARICKKSLLR